MCACMQGYSRAAFYCCDRANAGVVIAHAPGRLDVAHILLLACKHGHSQMRMMVGWLLCRRPCMPSKRLQVHATHAHLKACKRPLGVHDCCVVAGEEAERAVEALTQLWACVKEGVRRGSMQQVLRPTFLVFPDPASLQSQHTTNQHIVLPVRSSPLPPQALA